MIKLFGNLPNWFQMVVISIITFTVLYAFYLLVVKGFKITWGKKRLSMEKDQDNCMACPNGKSIIILINDTIKILTERADIVYYETLRQQMNYAEDRATQLIGMMQKVYLNLLRDRGINEAVGSTSFHIYRLVLTSLEKSMVNRIRHIFRENKLADMTDAEFKIYVNSKFDLIRTQASEFLNDEYFYAQDISREDLYTANMQDLPLMQTVINEVFERARNIAINNHKKLELLDKKMKNALNTYTGEVIKNKTEV